MQYTFYLMRTERLVLSIMLVAMLVKGGADMVLTNREQERMAAALRAEAASLADDADGFSLDKEFEDDADRTQAWTREPFSYAENSTLRARRSYAAAWKSARLFPFDPNTLSADGFVRLGFSPRQAAVILRYREKGGVFRQPSDFARIYVVTPEHFNRLQPFIKIDSEKFPTPPTAFRSQHDAPATKPLAAAAIDLNTADSVLLCSVKGIGPYFAHRIIAYRRRLGGYTDVAQLLDIKDFPAATLPSFRTGTTPLQRLKVNHMDARSLQRHPYISARQAHAIADLRRLHGTIHNAAELSQLTCFSADDIQKLLPYLDFSE